MSYKQVEQVFTNIKENILERDDSSVYLQVLENITENIDQFKELIDQGVFNSLIRRKPNSVVKMNHNLKQFLLEGDFGFPILPFDVLEINNSTDFITRGILNILFICYLRHNNLYLFNNHYKFDHKMYKFFYQNVEDIIKHRPNFDSENFSYIIIPSIINLNVENYPLIDSKKIEKLWNLDFLEKKLDEIRN